MAEGWIKLHRAIRKNWIWEDPQKLKWWLDILLQANHQEKKVALGNELIVVERGCFHTSELKLSQKWSVSKTTIRRFLEMLEGDNMITTKKTKKGTTIKVSNYEDYQGFSEEEKTIKKPQKNHEVYHKETIEKPYGIPQKNHEVYTNNNDKELNNENNAKEGEEGKEKVPSLPLLSIPTKYHEKIYNQWSEVTYKTWFMDSEIVEDGQDLKMLVNSKFKMEAINHKFSKHLGIILGKNIKVEIREDV